MSEATVNLASSDGAVSYRGAGFLHGINGAMADAFFVPLKGQLWRGSDFGANGVTLDNLYPRVTPATVELVMSDAWGYGANADLAAAGDFSTIDPIVTSLVNKYQNKAGGAWAITHDIWNEPNHGSFWPGTQAQFHTAWEHIYDLVRTLRPGAVIVGPSIATVFPAHTWETEVVWLQDFLTFCGANGCLPNRVAWHENGASQFTMGGHVSDMRAWMQTNLGQVLPIEINEIMSNYSVSPFGGIRPAEIVTYIAAAERAQVFGVCKSSWDTAPTLDGCLTATPETRSAWWAFRKYADLAGAMVTVTSDLQELDGVASLDGTMARALIACFNGTGGAHTVRMQDVPAALIRSGNVRVTTQPIADSGESVVAALPAPTTTLVAVSGGDAVIPLTFDAWSAMALTVDRPDATHCVGARHRGFA